MWSVDDYDDELLTYIILRCVCVCDATEVTLTPLISSHEPPPETSSLPSSPSSSLSTAPSTSNSVRGGILATVGKLLNYWRKICRDINEAKMTILQSFLRWGTSFLGNYGILCGLCEERKRVCPFFSC